jgi:hypothetical protein
MINAPVPNPRSFSLYAVTRLVLASLVASLVLLGGLPAAAQPGDGAGDAEEAGAPTTLLGQLEVTSHAYLDAKARLDASKARQTQLDQDLRLTEARLAVLRSQVGGVADAAYRGQQISLMSALLNNSSSDQVLRGMTTVSFLAQYDDHKLREYATETKQYAAQKKTLDDELRLQEQQTGEMQKQKDLAAAALKKASNGGVVNGIPVPLPTATQAPRTRDGTFAPEACTIDDPTTTGCITPRMLHAYEEVRKAGYTRFTGCHRDGDRFEHPKGRACDFSVTVKNFEDRVATGDARNYGDHLAGWLVGNADRLGVMYVIWFRVIWTPTVGWHAYEGSGGPAAEHTNHVHLSIL